MRPSADIVNSKVQQAGPDPFDMNEVELILADLAKHYDERVVACHVRDDVPDVEGA